jgi:hypothetical protein
MHSVNLTARSLASRFSDRECTFDFCHKQAVRMIKDLQQNILWSNVVMGSQNSVATSKKIQRKSIKNIN